jgi:glycosyltransferase involved in cell wall biosynthesis
MNVLFIAFSCSPFGGSEESIGWNIPFHFAQSYPDDSFYVFTKEEQQKDITVFFKDNGCPSNIHFIFVNIPAYVKLLFRGPFFSGRQNSWLRKVAKLLPTFCVENKIDIIHQLTPVEFRSIIDVSQLSCKKKVLGPIGGGEYVPKSLKRYLLPIWPIEAFRKTVNLLSKRKAVKKIRFFDNCLFANIETRSFLNLNSFPIFTEIGIEKNFKCLPTVNDDKKLNIVYSGRLVSRKGLDFLFDCLKLVSIDYHLFIFGTGHFSSKQKHQIKKFLAGKVSIMEPLSHFEMLKKYNDYDVLVMPSLRETTGSVILEALAQGLPVIAYNGFGAKTLLDKTCAYLYFGSNLWSIKESLVACIERAYYDKISGVNLKNICRLVSYENCWDEKIKYYNNLYRTE